MKIAIDGVKLSNKPCGLTNIAMAIIIALAKTGDHQIVVLMKSKPHPEIDLELSGLKEVEVIIEDPKFFKSNSIFWAIFQINCLVKTVNPDLFIAPNFLLSPWRYNKKIKTVVFVHDLIIKQYPETMHWFNRLHMEVLFKYSLKTGNAIWCNSRYTAEQLEHYFGLTIKRTPIFVGSGIKPFDYKSTATVKNDLIVKLNIIKPYILYVGTIEPRKNIKFLIDLYGELYSKYKLVMISGKGWGKTAEDFEKMLVDKKLVADNIVRVSNISTPDLQLYYRNAEFLISTSFNEGLGLPILEAMSQSCPVITPNNSAFTETVKNIEVTVEGWDLEDWKRGIAELLNNRSAYIDNGLKHIQKYNWDNVVGDFIKFINYN